MEWEWETVERGQNENKAEDSSETVTRELNILFSSEWYNIQIKTIHNKVLALLCLEGL